MIYVVTFDVDGTLFDSAIGNLKTMLDVLRVYGLNPSEIEKAREFYQNIFGVPTETATHQFLSSIGRSVDDADELATRYHDLNAKHDYPIFDDTAEALALLRENRYRLFASTNTRQDILDRRIRRAGLDAYLDAWFGKTSEIDDKINHKKLIVDVLGIDEKEFEDNSGLVGDARRDIEIANIWNVAVPIYCDRNRKSEEESRSELEGLRYVAIAHSLMEVLDICQRSR